MLTLTNKNLVISGASSGIGQACCVLASQLGANIIMIGRQSDTLEQTEKMLQSGLHTKIVCDITDYDTLSTEISNLKTTYEFIDGYVHSAGIEITKPFSFLKPKDYRQILEVNLISGLEICRLITKKGIIAPNGASLVFVSSIMAILGSPGLIAYNASKSAITSTIMGMALELASRKIRVNSVMPGCVSTPLLDNRFSNMSESEIDNIKKLHPLGIGTPESVANLICFLLSDLSDWITGANIPIDGGYAIQ